VTEYDQKLLDAREKLLGALREIEVLYDMSPEDAKPLVAERVLYLRNRLKESERYITH